MLYMFHCFTPKFCVKTFAYADDAAFPSCSFVPFIALAVSYRCRVHRCLLFLATSVVVCRCVKCHLSSWQPCESNVCTCAFLVSTQQKAQFHKSAVKQQHFLFESEVPRQVPLVTVKDIVTMVICFYTRFGLNMFLILYLAHKPAFLFFLCHMMGISMTEVTFQPALCSGCIIFACMVCH